LRCTIMNNGPVTHHHHYTTLSHNRPKSAQTNPFSSNSQRQYIQVTASLSVLITMDVLKIPPFLTMPVELIITVLGILDLRTIIACRQVSSSNCGGGYIGLTSYIGLPHVPLLDR
jgi:hypothetical protein